MKPREIVVTGAEGFVGRRLVPRLRALGHTVQALGRRDQIDLNDDAVVEKAVSSAEVIIHLAARVFVPDSFREPAAFYRANVLGTLNMLEAARRTGARFVLASAYVYGQPQSLLIREDHPLSAHSPYTETKIIAERIFRNYHETFGIHGAILRPFNIYGPGQDIRFLIPTLLAQSRTGRLNLQSSLPRRDFIYVDDVVEAYVKAVDSERTTLEAYNIASGESCSVRELVDLFQSLCGKSLAVEYAEKVRPDEINDTHADISKARSDLDWAPAVSLRKGLRRTLEAFVSWTSP
jgi:nucleoside-diphosphate-sugar epimerase